MEQKDFEKQAIEEIAEMAKVMNECCNYYDEQGNHLGNKCNECEDWSDDNHCCCSYNTKEATALYNAGWRKKKEWTRVEDGLPKENGKCWCAYTDLRGKKKIGIFEFCAVYNAAWDVNSGNVGKFTIFDGDCFVPTRVSVTHWMPYEIPEPPKMKGGAE